MQVPAFPELNAKVISPWSATRGPVGGGARGRAGRAQDLLLGMLVEEEALLLAPLGSPAPPLLDRMRPRPKPQHQVVADAHAAAIQAANAQARAQEGGPPVQIPLPRQVRLELSSQRRVHCVTKPAWMLAGRTMSRYSIFL